MRYPNVVIMILFLTLLPTANHAATSEDLRTVSVTGTAITHVLPDTLVWTVQVSELDKDLAKAKKASDEKAKTLIGLREALDLGPEDVQTGTLRVSREYDRNGTRKVFEGYRVSRTVNIVQRDLKEFDEFLEKVMIEGIGDVSLDYQTSKVLDLRMSTRLEAVRIAREKASMMAEALGAKLGKVLIIDEQGIDSARSFGNPFGNSAMTTVTPQAVEDLSAGTFSPGALDVRVSVNVTFELE